MLLVDSSIWIAVFRGELELQDLGDEPLATCPPVVQEILQGAADQERYAYFRAALLSVVLLDAPMPLQRYEEAARIFLSCRRGKSPIRARSSYDCLIAACAMSHGATLLHKDRDFESMRGVIPLKTRAL